MSALRIDRILGIEHGVAPVLGAVVAGFGVLFLLLGWRMHRLSLVAFCFALGAVLGLQLARWIHLGRLWGIVGGGSAFALLALLAHRAAVFVLAGLVAGAVLGAGARLVAPGGFWFGFAPGFLLAGLLSLWELRTLFILSTALLGAVGMWWGGAVVAGAWIYAPAATFHTRHPIAWAVMVGGLFLVGGSLQFKLSPKCRSWDEDDEQEEGD